MITLLARHIPIIILATLLIGFLFYWFVYIIYNDKKRN